METDPATDGTATSIFALVGRLLHAAGDKSMTTQQVPFQALVSEKAELALLAVEWRPVVDHFRVNLDFMDPLHVVTQLL